MRHTLLAFTALTMLAGCAASGSQVQKIKDREEARCAGQYTKQADAVNCEAKEVIYLAEHTAFTESLRLRSYYRAKESIAERYDAGKISKTSLSKQYAALNKKYAAIFKVEGGITDESAANVLNGAMLNYSLIK